MKQIIDNLFWFKMRNVNSFVFMLNIHSFKNFVSQISYNCMLCQLVEGQRINIALFKCIWITDGQPL